MSQLAPYDYQKECLSVLGEERIGGKNKALVVMASGLGKTVVAAFDSHSFLSRQGGRVLSLCHQNDISDQSYVTFQEVLGEAYSFGYLDGREKEFEPVDVLFASFQTMHNWREEFPPDTFDYIVVDESHHSPAETYLPTLEYFEPKFLLGITATPDRTDLQDIREIYGDEVYSLPLEDGLTQGLLAPVDYRLLTDELQNLKILNTPIGKLSIAKLNRELFIPRRDDEIARIIQDKIAEIENPRVMVFVPSIAYCVRLARILPDSAPIHSQMSLGKQAETLGAFRIRHINTVVTVDKFNEGIDVPDANVIVFLRSTASRTIFFQQLGRGLRKTEGKERVLVLDFVANCERLEMVHGLWSAVEESKDKIKNGPLKIEEPLVVDMGTFEFDESARNVLDVITGIRVGYTKETLIKQLRELAQELGRTPTKADISRAATLGKSAAYPTYREYFGSFKSAIKLAGLVYTVRKGYPHPRVKTTEQLLKELKALGEKYGRAPTKAEVDEASRQGKCASSSTYRRRFGSFSNAKREAGYEPPSHRSRRWSKEELKKTLKDLADELGHAPTKREVNLAAKKGKCATASTYAYHFGSYTKACKEAGLAPKSVHSKRRWTKKDLTVSLQALAKKYGRTPTLKEVYQASKQGLCASTSTYQRRFGSYTNACRKAGLKPNR